MTPSIGLNLRVTGYKHQGGRKYMEDEFGVAYQQTADEKDLEYAFFGIFDGHGGREAAHFAKEHLMDYIVRQKGFWADDDESVLKAIHEGFIQCHYAMWKELETWPKTASGLPSTAGTTASIAFIRRGKIYIGHVGDSAIVLGVQDPDNPDVWLAEPLTRDHKPESTEESERIQQCGGKVICKSGVPRVVWNRPKMGHRGPVRRSTHMDEIPFLAVARSLGDLWSYNSEENVFVVSPEPDIRVYPVDIGKHRCLILGTDGAWNMLTAQNAISIVCQAEKANEAHMLSPSEDEGRSSTTWINPSKQLVDTAIQRWTASKLRADNTSVVTVMLDPPGPPRAQVLKNRKRELAALNAGRDLLPVVGSSGGVASRGSMALVTNTTGPEDVAGQHDDGTAHAAPVLSGHQPLNPSGGGMCGHHEAPTAAAAFMRGKSMSAAAAAAYERAREDPLTALANTASGCSIISRFPNSSNPGHNAGYDLIKNKHKNQHHHHFQQPQPPFQHQRSDQSGAASSSAAPAPTDEDVEQHHQARYPRPLRDFQSTPGSCVNNPAFSGAGASSSGGYSPLASRRPPVSDLTNSTRIGCHVAGGRGGSCVANNPHQHHPSSVPIASHPSSQPQPSVLKSRSLDNTSGVVQCNEISSSSEKANNSGSSHSEGASTKARPGHHHHSGASGSRPSAAGAGSGSEEGPSGCGDLQSDGSSSSVSTSSPELDGKSLASGGRRRKAAVVVTSASAVKKSGRHSLHNTRHSAASSSSQYLTKDSCSGGPGLSKSTPTTRATRAKRSDRRSALASHSKSSSLAERRRNQRHGTNAAESDPMSEPDADCQEVDQGVRARLRGASTHDGLSNVEPSPRLRSRTGGKDNSVASSDQKSSRPLSRKSKTSLQSVSLKTLNSRGSSASLRDKNVKSTVNSVGPISRSRTPGKAVAREAAKVKKSPTPGGRGRTASKSTPSPSEQPGPVTPSNKNSISAGQKRRQLRSASSIADCSGSSPRQRQEKLARTPTTAGVKRRRSPTSEASCDASPRKTPRSAAATAVIEGKKPIITRSKQARVLRLRK